MQLQKEVLLKKFNMARKITIIVKGNIFTVSIADKSLSPIEKAKQARYSLWQ